MKMNIPQHNTRAQLQRLIGEVKPLNAEAMEQAKQRQSMLAKPPGSLGKLEEISIQLAGITGQVYNRMDKKMLLVFCADNGVVKEGVSSCPVSVTAAQTVNLARGKTGAAVLAEHFGCQLRVFDVGVAQDICEPGVVSCKVAYGTHNIAERAAMSEPQLLQAIFIGAHAAMQAVQDGAQVIGVGEMGIGNTTTASAILCALTANEVKAVTGKGAGLTQQAYLHKCAVIERSLQINRVDADDVLDVMAKLGGFDIAAMAGAFIGAAQQRVPVVIDGVISATAALCAYRLCPAVRAYMIASHASYEIGCQIAMQALSLKPFLQLDMRLGEGSGCPPAMMLIEAACAVMNRMATFEEAEIDDSYLNPIRHTQAFKIE